MPSTVPYARRDVARARQREKTRDLAGVGNASPQRGRPEALLHVFPVILSAFTAAMDREDADMEHREPVREDRDAGSGDRREREPSRGYDERDDRDRRERRSSRDRVSVSGLASSSMCTAKELYRLQCVVDGFASDDDYLLIRGHLD